MPALTPTPDAGRDDDAEHTDQREALVGVYEPTADGRECTVFPASTDAESLVTNWITVDADLLCDLDDWR